MGAFDMYDVAVPCPRCGDIHYLVHQTKFFDPDYDDQAYFYAGTTAVKATVDPATIAEEARRNGWLELRTRDRYDIVRILGDYSNWFRCGCGFPAATVAAFHVEAGKVTFVGAALCDGLDPGIVERIDFHDAELSGEPREAVQLAPTNVREQYVRSCLVDLYATWGTDDSSTYVTAPARCEACGDIRPWRRWTNLVRGDEHRSFFGPSWSSGTLMIGDRIPFDHRRLGDDVDLGGCFRVRHPIGTTLTIASHETGIGCRCGAGEARMILRFAREPGVVVLEEVTLRVVRDRAALADVDFIEGESRPHMTREQHLAFLFSR